MDKVTLGSFAYQLSIMDHKESKWGLKIKRINLNNESKHDPNQRLLAIELIILNLIYWPTELKIQIILIQ